MRQKLTGTQRYLSKNIKPLNSWKKSSHDGQRPPCPSGDIPQIWNASSTQGRTGPGIDPALMRHGVTGRRAADRRPNRVKGEQGDDGVGRHRQEKRRVKPQGVSQQACHRG